MEYKDLPPYIRCELTFAKICQQIETNGIQLDSDLVNQYINQLETEIIDIDKQLRPLIPQVKKKLDNLKSKHHINKWINSGQPYKTLPDGTIERWNFSPVNLNSIKTLKDYLLYLGWKPSDDPDAWNYKQIKTTWGKLEKVRDENGKFIRTSPKVPSDDIELDLLSKISPSFRLISDRIKRSNRMNILRGFLRNIRPDNRISMGIDSVGANTMRVKHRTVANIPRTGSFFGKEMKSVFTAASGKVLVGADADGLELRTIAHDINDPVFTDLVINGDVHQYIYEGLTDLIIDRASGKNLTYALLYGASDSKLGSMCNATTGNIRDIGKEVRKRYGRIIPNLDNTISRLEEQFDRWGYIQGIDGRWIKARHKYALLNTRGQSTGAILCKYWTIFYRKAIQHWQLDSKHIIFYHDSNTEECDPKIAEQIGKIMVAQIAQAGVYLNLNVPVSASYSIGKNWSEVK